MDPALDGTLRVVADPEAAADLAASLVADALVEAVAARGRADWATTGGSTAPGIYRRLAASPLVNRIPWDTVHVWWGDDRYVTPDDPDSNVASLLRGLVDAGVPIPAGNLHPFRGLPAGETDGGIGSYGGIDAAAEASEDELREAGLDEHDGFPVFDLVLLGMGGDGHILSVFPASAALAASEWVVAIPAPVHIEPHVERLTLNPAIVGAARLVIPVVAGPGKAEILARVLGQERDPVRLPAQLARGPRTTWVVDAAAASALPRDLVAGAPATRVADPDPSRDPSAPSRLVRSQDGTPIAVFESGQTGAPDIILVHGAAADHTTFRVIGPRLGERFRIHAIDRRGRGASGDGPAYTIEREFEDVAAVAEDIRDRTGRAVDVVGHSYGGRIALGASLRTDAIRRVVSYEGAPSAPGRAYHDAATELALAALIASGDHDGALALFMSDIVGMPAADLAAYRADPVWPIRVRAAPTLLREIDAERSAAASLEALGQVRVPVLQVLGGASIEAFGGATSALDERLVDGHIVTIPGARHAAHHTHADAFVAAVSAFLLDGLG